LQARLRESRKNDITVSLFFRPNKEICATNDAIIQFATSETAALVERLRSFSLPDGGLPYYRGNASSAEPTLLAALALYVSGAPAEAAKPLLAWAQKLQNPDGSVGVDPGHRDQGVWLTALAAIVLHHFGLAENSKRALDFLLSLRSITGLKDPRFSQDDTLTGWPWVPGTFGWVEPTAWSLIALNLSAIAIGFFVPTDVLFSAWFFVWLSKAALVTANTSHSAKKLGMASAGSRSRNVRCSR